MDELLEIRFHGRGGQGAVTAANILADAAVREGKYAQAFPHFGAERRGAPVVAFARISSKPIELHSRIEEPDIVVVLDGMLFKLVNVTAGLKNDGVIVANSRRSPRIEGSYKVYCVDATGIAIQKGLVVSGWPVVNTVMLGALSKVTGIVGIDSLSDVILSRFPEDVAGRNIEAMKSAAESVYMC
ncbi:MAG: 2-oxoacid:acceptor oxidoreductase family protein [Desulfurococcales archaeon]|nr:2-oxoacid:acceptor oxidoreductase family protein [Desulfurococcales archaeon]